MNRPPRAWLVTLGLAVAVVIGALAAASVSQGDDVGAQADPCFKYGRFECCLRPDD